APEDVTLDKTDNLEHFVASETTLSVVVIHVQQEGVGNVDLQLAQVMKGLLQRDISLRLQCHCTVVRRVGMDVGDQVSGVALGGARERLERGVDLAYVRNLTGLGRQVVPHESVEV